MASTTVDAASWKDSKRYAWLMGLLIPTLPLLGWGGVEATGWSLFWWIGPIVYYVIIPPLELLFGEDLANPPESAVASLEKDRYYRWCVYLYIPLHFVSLLAAAWVVASLPLSWVDVLGLATTMGLASGIGINTAHELGHKKESLDRWLSRIALAPVAYGHFYIEHTRGHHVRVATPEDPASSRFGESFWAFLPRTVIGSAKSAWHLEAQRLQRLGKSPWTVHNDVLNAWAVTLVLFGGIVAWLGPAVIPFLVIQACIGFTLLEVVNYLEHYGLVRQKGADGRYERCQPRHSWNSNHVVTNLLLYHLQRHSDHHANPTRSYQALRHFDEAPRLPSGYTTMILLAYFPPIWRYVMDHRVVAHYKGDIAQANLLPEKREALIAQFSTVGTGSRVGA